MKCIRSWDTQNTKNVKLEKFKKKNMHYPSLAMSSWIRKQPQFGWNFATQVISSAENNDFILQIIWLLLIAIKNPP